MKINELINEGVFDAIKRAGSAFVDGFKQGWNGDEVNVKHDLISEIPPELEQASKSLDYGNDFFYPDPKVKKQLNAKYWVYIVTSPDADTLFDQDFGYSFNLGIPEGGGTAYKYFSVAQVVNTDKGEVAYLGPFVNKQKGAAWVDFYKKEFKYYSAITFQGYFTQLTGYDIVETLPWLRGGGLNEAIKDYCDACDRIKSKCICDEPVAENSKYLGPTEKVKSISPVLGNTKRKMQTPLDKKFFGGS